MGTVSNHLAHAFPVRRRRRLRSPWLTWPRQHNRVPPLLPPTLPSLLRAGKQVVTWRRLPGHAYNNQQTSFCSVAPRSECKASIFFSNFLRVTYHFFSSRWSPWNFYNVGYTVSHITCKLTFLFINLSTNPCTLFTCEILIDKIRLGALPTLLGSTVHK